MNLETLGAWLRDMEGQDFNDFEAGLGAYDECAELVGDGPQREWVERTRRALQDAAERFPGQRLHRERLAGAGIPLPENALVCALTAMRERGSFSAWLQEQRR